MNITWHITETDIHKIRDVIDKNTNPFVNMRRLRNVERVNIQVDKNTIVKAMLSCLLTSQQRSGPNTRVGQFLIKAPYPVTIEAIGQVDNVRLFIKNTLRENGLTRFIDRISGFFTNNFRKIQDDDWKILSRLNQLDGNHTPADERQMADDINAWFEGFGPKQSRNFLQALGLTKYEIPIDSRITNWLNRFGFPVTLDSGALGNKGYYHFVSDGIQVLCEKAGVYPCILDAAIFSSFDNDEWTEKNVVF